MIARELPKQTDNHFSSQKESIYPFEYQHNSASFVCDSSSEQGNAEPFNNEKEAIDFANFYAQKAMNEER